MTFLRYISPVRAIRDLRRYLATRPAYELWCLMAAMAITLVLLWMFVKDSHVESPYKPPEIIYVQQWPITRTDAQIKAQQAKDLPGELKQKAELEAKRKKLQDEYKRLDAKVGKWL